MLGSVLEQAISRLQTGLRETETETLPLVEFVRQSWPLIEPNNPYIHNWHVDALCIHLEALVDNQIQNLIINMPPRFLKSLIVSVCFPAWVWTVRPEYRMLFSSYSAGLSTRDAVRTRRIIDSHWYQSRWGNIVRFSSDQNQKTRYENTFQGCRVSSSVGGTNTGEGGHLIVVDDPHNVLETYSEVKRQSAIDWWNTVMPSRLNDPKRDHKLIVAQRIHEEDLSGIVLKQGGYVHLNLPNEFEPKLKCKTPLWEDPRTEPGELLFYRRLGPRETETLRTNLGTYVYSAQYQQNPSSPEGGLAKREWWKFYDEEVRFNFMAQTWDMAFKDTGASSYVVGQVWGFRGAFAYLVYQVRERLSFTNTIKVVERLTSRFPEAHLKLVEDKANGPAVINFLRSKIPGLVPVEPKGSKAARAAVITPLIESGNVYLPEVEKNPWVGSYIEEWAKSKPLHWDQIDATSQLLSRWAIGLQGGNSYTWGKDQ